VGALILARSDLEALTGYVRASAQIRWLRRNGWRFVVNALGNPVVAQAEFDRHLVGGKRPPPTQEPNWDAINDGKGKP
jgi:hypothetical protein